VVGEVVAERYELEELVGSGGMSSVFRATDTLLERKVALKILHEEYTNDADYVERFRREARAVAQLAHPNIVTVIDRGEQDGRQFIVFEYVDGESLKHLVDRTGPLPVEEAVELALQVARALSFAHQQGLVHRDVKPQNVLLNDDGRAKVTDFGIARSLDLDVQHGLTQTGTVMGTSDYIAPEQARGERVDEQTDIYSLGVVLYELLTGEVPFPGDNFVAVAMRHINEPPPSARARRPDVPARLDAAIRRAMAKEPSGRFASMAEFAGELEASLDVSPEADTGEIVLPRRRRRRPSRRLLLWALLVVLGVGVLVGAGVGAFLLVGRSTGSKHHAPPGSQPVHLVGRISFDPFGDNKTEHDELVSKATDGDPATFWTTEEYRNGLQKQGVGIVLDANRSRTLSTLTIVTDTPGFTAIIRAGPSSSGPFVPVSGRQLVSRQTTFRLHGKPARYYLIWIKDLGSLSAAHVNEVRARS
jgi:serine/threonine-protein kinase